MYIKLVNGNPEIYSIMQLRKDNPYTSFPADFPDKTLARYDVYRYTRPEYPECNHLIENIIDGEFEQDSDGNWILPYVKVNLPVEEAESNVRAYRDQLLTQCDWVVSYYGEKNMPIPEEWTTYRQALRDITDQEGFPYIVNWPEQPL